MHITLETDYAVRIVDRLVKNGKRTGAKAISEAADVPQRFALKILRKLSTAGIVKSYKGAGGGYELALPPEKISLYDIVELVEGSYCFSRCVREEYVCSCTDRSGGLPCAYRHVFGEITEKVSDMLKTQTFDKLAEVKGRQ